MQEQISEDNDVSWVFSKENIEHWRVVTNKAFGRFDSLGQLEKQETRHVIDRVIDALDQGRCRLCEKINGEWIYNDWLKKAIFLYFQLSENQNMLGHWWDKIELKYADWLDHDFLSAGFRAVPGSVVRRGVFIDKGAVVMPSFINIGARIGAGTMIDTWATVGSCAQIGVRVHISGGVGIGGVLEPVQMRPVIVEDFCFIGARSEIAEGVLIQEGSVIGMGVYLSASTKIIHAQTGEIFRGTVPPYSVVISGTAPFSSEICNNNDVRGYCAVIIKTVDEKTRSKTMINDLLRLP